jgi:hypothetical protein
LLLWHENPMVSFLLSTVILSSFLTLLFICLLGLIGSTLCLSLFLSHVMICYAWVS